MSAAANFVLRQLVHEPGAGSQELAHRPAGERHGVPQPRRIEPRQRGPRPGPAIAGFAARARVSRVWIYAQPRPREQIDELRGRTQQSSPPTRGENASDASLRTRLQLTLQRIRDLEAEYRLLNDQVALLYGGLRHTKITPPVVDTAHDTDNLIRLP